jgi:hypothetical protein
MEHILPIPTEARVALVKRMVRVEDHDGLLDNPEK